MRLVCLTDNFRFGGLETRVDSYLPRSGWHRILAQSVGTPRADIEQVRFFAVLPLGFRQVTDALTSRLATLAPDHVEIHPFAAFTTGFSAAARLNLPVSLHFHGPASLRLPGPGWQTALFRALLREYRPTIVVTSEEVAALFRVRFGEGHEVRLIRNGVDPASRVPPARSGLRIAFVSRLDPDKIPGALALLDLVSRIPSTRLDIIGAGGARPELERAIRARGLAARVRCLGYRPSPASGLAPGQTIAGCGRALLEGLATGRRGLLVSSSRVVAPMTRANFAAAGRWNWSGRGMAPASARQVRAFLEAGPSPAFDLASCVPKDMAASMRSIIRDTVRRHRASPPVVDVRHLIARHFPSGDREPERPEPPSPVSLQPS